MKVLHVCYSDLAGGAARAAYRLHKAQLAAGINSQMLVVDKRSDDLTVIRVGLKLKIYIQIIEKLSQLLLKFSRTTNTTIRSLNLFPTGLSRFINKLNIDVVNLHWVNGSMMSISEIADIKAPLVWTLHDMWAFCGTEHYDDLNNPERYKLGYSRETKPISYKGIDWDRFNFYRKERLFKKKKIDFVTPSKWLADCLIASKIYNNQPVTIIPNTLDNNIYKPLNKSFCRTVMSLPEDKVLFLFGAMSSTSDERKGFHLLKSAFSTIDINKIKDKCEFVVFGASSGNIEEELGLKTHYLGTLHDDITLSILYNAADYFIAPSMQDNLPNTLLESLCCLTPCIAFDIGGIPDLINSSTSGKVVAAFDCKALGEVIKDFVDKPIYGVKNNKLITDIKLPVKLYLEKYKSL